MSARVVYRNAEGTPYAASEGSLYAGPFADLADAEATAEVARAQGVPVEVES